MKIKITEELKNLSCDTNPTPEDHQELWHQERPQQNHTINYRRKKALYVLIILSLGSLTVLLPAVVNNIILNDLIIQEAFRELEPRCYESCRMTLAESIPEGLVYPKGAISLPSTYETWMGLIDMAQSTIEIGSFYWTLQKTEFPSSQQGENVFQALLKAGTKRGIKIKIAQNAPTVDQPNIDTIDLEKMKAAEVRSLNFSKLLGAGVLHTKVWIIDRKHFYVGSANMDWRALTQVKEMGAAIYNCSCISEDIAKIFDVYWTLGEKGATIPTKWPSELSTQYGVDTPMNMTLNNDSFSTYISSSPPPFSPDGRTSDIDAILNIMSQAKKFIYIAVMDYFPLTIYTPHQTFWPIIDNALRAAAIDQSINVRLLISRWNHSHPSEDHFLQSLQDIDGAHPKVKIQIKRFRVPVSNDQKDIPYARVNHNKYMVTDNTAYIGTSNWSGDYFIDTAGIGLVMHESANGSKTSVRAQLEAVFERDWDSPYATEI